MLMIDALEILKDLEDTDPILLTVLGTAFLAVCAWTASIFVSTQSKSSNRTRRRGPVKIGEPRAPRIAPGNLGTLVEALQPADRDALGEDLARLIQKHRNKRFLAFVVVQRENVGPVSFAFLYQALRAHNRPISEIHEFQISVRDATELLRACSPESSRV
jgi:hypothetical protein